MAAIDLWDFPSIETPTKGDLITVVISNFNYGDFLAEAIDSALKQTYSHVEVVVVNDGSTDDSVSVIESFGTSIRPLIKENGGHASSINAGFQASRGSAVCFLDADDVMHPHVIEDAMKVFDEQGCVKVHWALEITDTSGNRTGGTFPPGEMPQGDLRDRVREEGPLYDAEWLPPTSGSIWARSFLNRVLPIPEAAFRAGTDVYLHVLAPVFGRLGKAERPGGLYRVHGQNDYWDRPLSPENVAKYMGYLEVCFESIGKHLTDLGIEVETDLWRRQNWNYVWLRRLQTARSELEEIVSPEDRLALIGSEELGDPEVVLGRYVRVFPEQDGEYAGPPPDSDAAIAAVEDFRSSGGSKLGLWWTSFWWFDHYPEFARFLRTSFPTVADNDSLIVFDLNDADKTNGLRN